MAESGKKANDTTNRKGGEGGAGSTRGNSTHGEGAGAEDIRKMICIVCPIGCRLRAEVLPPEDPQSAGEPEVKVTGNKCPRGEEYAREEVLAPKRTVTATCRVLGARGVRRIPVKTDAPLPVEHIDELLSKLYEEKLEAPVPIGYTVFENVAETGVNLLTTRSVEAEK